MTRFERIFEFERLHLVLQDVGECDASTFDHVDGTNVLHAGLALLTSKNGLKPGMIVPRIHNVFSVGI